MNKNKYPLRKIIDYINDENGFQMEVLECGHKQYPVRDIYGETNAYRRRCKKCYQTGGTS